MTGQAAGAESARLEWNLEDRNLDQDVLAYPANDAGAREMAQRLGALAGGSARTAALPHDSIDFSMKWQMAGAFILPLDQAYPTGCLQRAAFLGKADWLQEATRDLVRPLGLGRSWLVVHGSLSGIELAYDGTPLLAGLGASVDPEPGEATP